MEAFRAAIGDQNMINAFWLVVGSMAISNIGLIIQAFISYFKKINKAQADIKSAHDKIRELQKQITKE